MESTHAGWGEFAFLGFVESDVVVLIETDAEGLL
jgi:hypothetical protein